MEILSRAERGFKETYSPKYSLNKEKIADSLQKNSPSVKGESFINWGVKQGCSLPFRCTRRELKNKTKKIF